MQKRIDVAIGIVVHEGKVLVCQRRDDALLGGYWEFPGGKREAGESLEQCLVRELREELAIDVAPTAALVPIDHEYPHASVRIYPQLCALLQGEPTPIACQKCEWVEPARLSEYRFPEANDRLIEYLTERLSARQPQA